MSGTRTPRMTPNGLHATYDDGQNAFVEELLPCPFCGASQGHRGPYVQVGPMWGYGSVDARVVCGCCHVATSHETSIEAHLMSTGEDVTRDVAIEKAVAAWNSRA